MLGLRTLAEDFVSQQESEREQRDRNFAVEEQTSIVGSIVAIHDHLHDMSIMEHFGYACCMGQGRHISKSASDPLLFTETI